MRELWKKWYEKTCKQYNREPNWDSEEAKLVQAAWENGCYEGEKFVRNEVMGVLGI